MKEELTEQQKEAIEYINGPLLIVAGPGAGKTRVLIERINFMVRKKKINPENILVTTFTIKAAEEIKRRIVKIIGSEAQSMQISTIHSLCQNILELYPDSHEIGGTFDVLDAQTQFLFFRTYFYSMGLKNLIKQRDLSNLISFYNILSENCINPDVLISKYEELNEHEDSIKIIRSYKKYLELLKQEYKIDFAGLQKVVLNILKTNKEVLKDLQDRYQYLLIDEYQDTNAIQAEIFKLLAGQRQNICVVGDEDQSIYGFRGANIDNFRTFADIFKHTKVIKLEKNFRSKKSIVTIADNFIKPYRSFQKDLSPVRGKGNDVVLVRGSNAQNEAELVVKTIQILKEKKIIPHYGYVALLFKSVNYHAPPFLNKFEEEGIEVEVTGAGNFMKKEEIQTILYLMAYVDPPDYMGKFSDKWDSWWNISMFKTEILNLSDKTIKILNGISKEFDIGTLLTKKDFDSIGIANTEDIDKLKTLNYLKKELTNKEKGILEIFYEVVKRTKYLNRLFLQNDDDSKSRLFNLAILTQLIDKYEGINRKPSIEDFLWYLRSIPRDIDAKSIENPYAVKMMTIHQAKGLEFPIVFICSVMKGRFPRYHKTEELLLPIPEELLLAKPERGIGEERRLFYVGMTRAQDSLIISTADKVNTRGGGISPFIQEDIGLGEFKTPNDLIECCEERPPKEPPTTKLSYSSLNTYQECPFRFNLIYGYDFQTPAGFRQNYGIIVHNSLHRLHILMKKGKKIDFAVVKNIVDKSWIKIYNDKKKDDKCREKLQIDLYYKYYDYMKDYIKEVISTEEPFTLVFDEYIVTGRIDLIIKNKNDEIELIDFKYMEEIGITKTNVEMQLRIYEYAMKKKHKINKLCAYTFKDNKRIYFKTNREVLRDLDNELKDIVHSIRDEKFEAKKNAFCNKCIFKFTCKVWGVINEKM